MIREECGGHDLPDMVPWRASCFSGDLTAWRAGLLHSVAVDDDCGHANLKIYPEINCYDTVADATNASAEMVVSNGKMKQAVHDMEIDRSDDQGAAGVAAYHKAADSLLRDDAEVNLSDADKKRIHEAMAWGGPGAVLLDNVMDPYKHQPQVSAFLDYTRRIMRWPKSFDPLDAEHHRMFHCDELRPLLGMDKSSKYLRPDDTRSSLFAKYTGISGFGILCPATYEMVESVAPVLRFICEAAAPGTTPALSSASCGLQGPAHLTGSQKKALAEKYSSSS